MIQLTFDIALLP